MVRRLILQALLSRARAVGVMLPAVLLGALALVVSASGASVTSGSNGTLGTVVIRLSQDFFSLDPYVAAGRAQPYSAAAPGYDYLVAFNRKGNNYPYVPYLASSWTQTTKSITFHIRKGATCTDGHVLTAVDVLNSFKEFLNVPKTTGTFGSNSAGGFGLGPWSMHANNKKGTFTLTSKTPYRDFLSQFVNDPVICPSGISALQANPAALDNSIAGSGPYQLVSAAHNDKIVWQLRPQWNWGPAGTSTKTMPQTLIYQIVPDETTAANLLLTGGLNIDDASGPDVQRLLADTSLVHHVSPNYLVWVMVFMMKPGSTLADESLRQAIMTAIDKQKFLAAAFGGYGAEVSPSVFRPGATCYDPKTASLNPTTSIANAQQLLAQDGWTLQNGKLMKNGQQLTLHLVMSQLMNAAPDYVDSVLTQLGINVVYDNLPGSTYGTFVTTGNFDITVLRGSVIAGDPGLNVFPFAGAAPPAGKNEASTGIGDNQLAYYLNTGFENPGQGGCKDWALYQERLLQKHYALPILAANFDLFGNGVDFPPIPPDQAAAFPTYYLKATA